MSKCDLHVDKMFPFAGNKLRGQWWLLGTLFFERKNNFLLER